MASHSRFHALKSSTYNGIFYVRFVTPCMVEGENVENHSIPLGFLYKVELAFKSGEMFQLEVSINKIGGGGSYLSSMVSVMNWSLFFNNMLVYKPIYRRWSLRSTTKSSKISSSNLDSTYFVLWFMVGWYMVITWAR